MSDQDQENVKHASQYADPDKANDASEFVSSPPNIHQEAQNQLGTLGEVTADAGLSTKPQPIPTSHFEEPPEIPKTDQTTLTVEHKKKGVRDTIRWLAELKFGRKGKQNAA
jgi:hypothetical protein